MLYGYCLRDKTKRKFKQTANEQKCALEDETIDDKNFACVGAMEIRGRHFKLQPPENIDKITNFAMRIEPSFQRTGFSPNSIARITSSDVFRGLKGIWPWAVKF